MEVVVDTNIVFSAMLNIDSSIAQILLFNKTEINFYSCNFLKFEIAKHRLRIIKLTGYSEIQFAEIEFLVTKNIQFLNHELIDDEIMSKSKELLIDVDLDDVPFLAMAKNLNAKLWTGDKKLIKGLKKKGFNDIVSTEDLASIKD